MSSRKGIPERGNALAGTDARVKMPRVRHEQGGGGVPPPRGRGRPRYPWSWRGRMARAPLTVVAQVEHHARQQANGRRLHAQHVWAQGHGQEARIARQAELPLGKPPAGPTARLIGPGAAGPVQHAEGARIARPHGDDAGARLGRLHEALEGRRRADDGDNGALRLAGGVLGLAAPAVGPARGCFGPPSLEPFAQERDKAGRAELGRLLDDDVAAGARGGTKARVSVGRVRSVGASSSRMRTRAPAASASSTCPRNSLPAPVNRRTARPRPRRSTVTMCRLCSGARVTVSPTRHSAGARKRRSLAASSMGGSHSRRGRCGASTGRGTASGSRQQQRPTTRTNTPPAGFRTCRAAHPALVVICGAGVLARYGGPSWPACRLPSGARSGMPTAAGAGTPRHGGRGRPRHTEPPSKSADRRRTRASTG